jgi:replicative superfamily II helicase
MAILRGIVISLVIIIGEIMPQSIELKDQNNLVKTEAYPHANYPFKFFNPVQSRVFELYDKDCNIIVAASTSAGKTICAELAASYELSKNSGKIIYLAPLKALAKEKLDDWQSKNHHFSSRKIAIVTGDYRLTDSRKRELEEAEIIAMTSEMLNSRLRNFQSERNEWLCQTRMVIVDESHLLTVPGRGDHLEVGLMKLSRVAPNVRYILLSATMPNVKEIADWIGYVLSTKQTHLISSTYRPCPLGIHYELYEPAGYYEDTERVKIETALQVIEDYKEDRFLVFVHTKRTGEMLKKEIQAAGYECEFHNADLDKDKRHDVEKRFRSGKLQIIVATSTLAWGLNLPARRVIILGIHRGLNFVDTYDIWQMAGRAGRPGFDPRGDVYILLPKNDEQEHRERIEEHQPIVSRLLDYVGGGEPDSPKHYKTLAFHLVSEIHHGNIKTKAEVHDWYKKSLACFQAQDLGDDIVDDTLESLIMCGAIKDENGTYKTTTTGVIASMFYYSPFDVADLRRNFKALFANNMEKLDWAVSMCLADVDSYRASIVSKADRLEMSHYAKKIAEIFGEKYFTEAAIKHGYIYFCLMNGRDAGSMVGQSRNIQFDFPRTAQVLKVIDSLGCKWGREEYFKTLEMRVAYGVDEHLVGLCQVSEIGRVRAQRLYEAGIKTSDDIVKNKDRIAKIAGVSAEKAKEIVESAEMISFSRTVGL